MRCLGAVVAISLLSLGCKDESRATDPTSAPMGPPIEILLEANQGLPRFDIEATFGSTIDPKPHVQPVTTALVAARVACLVKDAPVKPELASVIHVEVRGKRIHAEAKSPTASCLAHAMDGKPIDDPVDYVVDLLVTVG
jgi:hypothetical protein